MVYIRCKLTEVRDIDLYRVSEACDIDPLVKVIPQGQGHHRSGQIVWGQVPDVGVLLCQHDLTNKEVTRVTMKAGYREQFEIYMWFSISLIVLKAFLNNIHKTKFIIPAKKFTYRIL